MKKVFGYFTIFEFLLAAVSVALVIVLFCVFDGKNYMSLMTALTGILSLLFIVKGNPIGQMLTIVFSVTYGIISFYNRYYGEMITYLAMTAPMAVLALVSWLKHPYNGNKSEVAVNRISGLEALAMFVLTGAVTVVFYFILDAFDTANIIPSTISVATSFVAVYLTFRRSPFYALGYVANDIVLIVLWSMIAATDISYITVDMIFVVFFVFDVYGFINWLGMQKRQEGNAR